MVNHINPKVRAYGKARLDFTLRAENEAEWLQGWHDALYEFPFQLSNGWRFGFEYKVDDFAAEIGFFVDQLGFPVVSFSPSYAQFTNPEQDFIFSIAQALEGEISTPPETVRLHLQVLYLEDTVEELQTRGIEFEQEPYLLDSNSSMVASFRSPHGISIDLWQSVDKREEEVPDDGMDEDDLYQDEVIDGHIQSGYDREIVTEEVGADDDLEYQEEPIDERFEESKRHNYRLWDEDEENHEDYEDDDDDNEAEQPLILKTSADKDDFLDKLLKETGDRKADSEIDVEIPVQAQEEAGESRKNNRLAKTRSVLLGLRANHHKTPDVLQSDVEISSGRAMHRNRLNNMNDDDLGDDLYEHETFSEDELVYQEIDDGNEDYPE